MLGNWSAHEDDIEGGADPHLVHDLVRASARVSPDALAVADPHAMLTYGVLERRANGLAHRLRDLGVRPGVLVGLCHDRSVSAVVGALSVLKAGGGYVGLDPGYPSSSLEHMLRDAGVRVLLTQESVNDRMLSIPCDIVDLDRIHDEAVADEPPLGSPRAGDVAYVIYTSGSTGAPKGVAVSHRSLFNLVHWHLEAFDVTSSDRASMVASPAFDASVWELWPYLVAGASLHIPDRTTSRVPAAMRDWLVGANISIGFAPTPMAEAMLALEWPPTSSLRFMLTGGDVLHRRPSPEMPFTLVNNYGVTEATVVSTSGTVTPGGADGVLPDLGRPLPNVRLYVLDEAGHPVPSGTPGELYIGGPSVAMGYLKKPDLTAERFVPDPWCREPGARMYRTGDAIRITDDGRVEFLGRLDQQVSIRGYRIEPDEIAAALSAHPAVGPCAVVARRIDEQNQRLVAYVVPASAGTLPDWRDLRRHLATHLPEHMIPTAFVELDALPLTANGKLDRAALPATTGVLSHGEAESGAAGPTETALVEILEDLLEMKGVGWDDNFFALGGHSLMGAQLVTRVQYRFGVELSLLAIFENPTVAQMAAVIDENVRSSADQEETAGEAGPVLLEVQAGSFPALFCIQPEDGSLIALRNCLPALGPERAVYGLMPSRLDRRTSIEEMADQFLSRILKVQPEGPYLLAGYSIGGMLVYELAGRLRQLGHEVRFLGLVDTRAPAEWMRQKTWRSRGSAVLRWGIQPAALEAVQLGRKRFSGVLPARRRSGQGPVVAQRRPWSHGDAIAIGARYRPVGQEGPLVVFAAREGRRSYWPRSPVPVVPEADHGRWSLRHLLGPESPDRTLGWGSVHRAPIQAFVVPGAHRTVFASENVGALADALAGAIRDAHEATSRSSAVSVPARGRPEL